MEDILQRLYLGGGCKHRPGFVPLQKRPLDFMAMHSLPRFPIVRVLFVVG